MSAPAWIPALVRVAAFGAFAYLLALGWLYWRQEKLLFQPEVLSAEHRFAFDPDVHELKLPVPGATLSALHLKLPAPNGVVFYLHGNGGSLNSWFVNADFYRTAGYDLFMLDYRGYGKSTGRVESEAQLRADVKAAWDLVAPQYAGLKRAIYGRSLGTGLAVGLAAEVQPDLLILVSPFSSMKAVMADHYPLVPGALLRYPLQTDALLPTVQSPVLMIHGEQDALIAPRHSETLLPLAKQGRRVLIPQAGHNDLQNFESYLAVMREALRQHARPHGMKVMTLIPPG